MDKILQKLSGGQKNVLLKNYTTYKIGGPAKYFFAAKTKEKLTEAIAVAKKNKLPVFILGGGSNILFTKNFDGIVILNRLKGIEILKEDSENVWIKSMGGVIWNDLVIFAVDRGLWGIENLALIPGTVGATPVQNIGAYGVELKDTLENVEAYDIENGEKKILSNKECEFGYRESIFKTKLKGKYFISSITLKLNKKE